MASFNRPLDTNDITFGGALSGNERVVRLAPKRTRIEEMRDIERARALRLGNRSAKRSAASEAAPHALRISESASGGLRRRTESESRTSYQEIRPKGSGSWRIAIANIEPGASFVAEMPDNESIRDKEFRNEFPEPAEEDLINSVIVPISETTEESLDLPAEPQDNDAQEAEVADVAVIEDVIDQIDTIDRFESAAWASDRREAENVSYTYDLTGLEGHNFLPTREEVLAEMEAIETADRHRQIILRLQKLLGADTDTSVVTKAMADVSRHMPRDTEMLPPRNQPQAVSASAAEHSDETPKIIADKKSSRQSTIRIPAMPRQAGRVFSASPAGAVPPVNPPRRQLFAKEDMRSRPALSGNYGGKRQEALKPQLAQAAVPKSFGAIIQESVPYKKPDPKSSHNEKSFSFPRFQLRLPRMRMPSLTLPRITLPPFPKIRIAMPRPTMPHLAMPRLSAAYARAGIMVLVVLVVGGGIFAAKQYASNTADTVRSEGLAAYRQMLEGLNAALRQDFTAAQGNFAQAYEQLKNLGGGARLAGKGLALIADTFSLSSQTTSGVFVLDAAQEFAKAGEELAAYAAIFNRNGIGSLTPTEFITGYLTDADLQQAKQILGTAILHLERAEENLSKVDSQTLPEEFRDSIAKLRGTVPGALTIAKEFSNFQDALFDVLGYTGPRKYLVLFQNNAELRPTGGFIGSYALIDVLDGKITKLFIDDVFNIDGQLIEKVAPPFPIQKISTAWSLHDANWFFDYPTSAKKISWFYEKAGGATVDGVIAITPQVLASLLALTGPLDLPAYENLQLNQQNFRDELSYLIEVATPKQEGESPKIVLRDIGNLLFDRLESSIRGGGIREILDTFAKAIERRDIMLWVKQPTIESFLLDHAWAGAIGVSLGDYLAIVHTNINGYKTDRVIRDEISHHASIASDGSVIDTVTITRTHPGTPSQRYAELYQKVNADYLRVYVPKGSHLIDAEGQTIETYTPPIDYAAANFSEDEDISNIESAMRTHYPSGTHIFEEGGKTVFGNWVFVSPGESVTVRYTYKLPWTVKTDGSEPYVMLVQKQAGHEQALFTGTVTGAEEFTLTGEMPQKASFEKDIEYSVRVQK
ncbi:MAG: DUF4012 domain-containing protein [bacterium]|nr:DUF4012 domain-containing protein [bacterium]